MKRKDLQISVRSDPKLLACIRALLRRYLECLAVSQGRAEEIVLAVDEACANAIRHAYGGRRNKTLELTVRSDRSLIEIELRDEGTPAPADRVAPKRLGVSDPETLTPGGLGIPLIYQVFDEVSFAPGEKRGNRVTTRVKRPQ